MEQKKSKSALSDTFYAGILGALAVVAVHDEETIFREIVGTVDEAELIRIARRDRAMRWSGLARYGYGREVEADAKDTAES